MLSRWCAALNSFGVKRAVLVVSHGCGFNTFPSRTAFPELGFVYNYSVAYSSWLNGTGDVARMFIAVSYTHLTLPTIYSV